MLRVPDAASACPATLAGHLAAGGGKGKELWVAVREVVGDPASGLSRGYVQAACGKAFATKKSPSLYQVLSNQRPPQACAAESQQAEGLSNGVVVIVNSVDALSPILLQAGCMRQPWVLCRGNFDGSFAHSAESVAPWPLSTR